MLVGGCGFSGPRTNFASGDDGGIDARVAMVDASELVDAVPVDAARPIDATPIVIDALIHDAFVPMPDANPWPCGPEPIAPSGNVMWGNPTTNTTLSMITGSRLEVVAPGASITLGFTYAIHDTACPTACRDQIEFGFVPGGRAGCAFDNGVSEASGAGGTAQISLVAPTTPGAYDVRVDLAQAAGCGTTTAWWANVTPPPMQTLATICVH